MRGFVMVARVIRGVGFVAFLWYSLWAVYHVGVFYGPGWGWAAWVFLPVAAFVAPYLTGAGVHFTVVLAVLTVATFLKEALEP